MPRGKLTIDTSRDSAFLRIIDDRTLSTLAEIRFRDGSSPLAEAVKYEEAVEYLSRLAKDARSPLTDPDGLVKAYKRLVASEKKSALADLKDLLDEAIESLDAEAGS